MSVGWNISEESFFDRFRWLVNSLKLRFSYGTTGNQNFPDYSYAFRWLVNSLKLRFSYGTTGNQNFPDYSYAPAIYKNYDYTFGTGTSEILANGFTQLGFANPNVKWETTQQLNAGIDMALYNNKLILGLDLYKSNKKNMLFPMVVPPSNGGGQSSTVTLNAGDMENRGVATVKWRGPEFNCYIECRRYGKPWC